MNTEDQNEKDKLVKKRQGDLIVFLPMLAICLGWIWVTLDLPFQLTMTWPGMLPMVLLSLIVVMILGALVIEYRPNPGYRNLRPFFNQGLSSARQITLKNPMYRGALTMLFLFGYWFLLTALPSVLQPPQSYVISTFAFVFGLTVAFKAHKIWVCGLTAVLTSAFLYVVFGMFYRIPLP